MQNNEIIQDELIVEKQEAVIEKEENEIRKNDKYIDNEKISKHDRAVVETCNGHVVKLERGIENFEGPIDFLFYLIKKNKINIEDIFISEITGQFLEYIKELQNIEDDIERIGEFFIMASTLVEIKARKLLPIEEENDDEEESVESKIIRELYELEVYQKASTELANYEFVITDLDSILSSYSQLLLKVAVKEGEKKNPKQIERDIVTVQDKIQNISSLIIEKKETSFFALFDNATSKFEVITTFQAILELLKMQIIAAKQDESFKDINIILKASEEDIMAKIESEDFSAYDGIAE